MSISQSNISIVGIGKLGLCLGLNLESKGYNVIGCDLNENYVNELNNKTFNSLEPGVNTLLANSKNFKATTSLAECINFSKNIFVMVATPSLANGKYDHTQIEDLITRLIEIGPQKEEKLLIIGCTTFPGYCDTIVDKVRKLNYSVLYNPEFIAQGNILNGQTYPDMVLIGETNQASGDELEKIHRSLCKNKPAICRLNLVEAEVTKLSINCFITTKISFANMIGDLCNKLGVSHDLVLKSIGKDTRIGEKYLSWGFGFGGPCFPRDNRALGILCQENMIYPSIPKASDEYNKIHLDHQCEHIMSQIKEDKMYTMNGVSYKKGSSLIEESQQLKIAEMLADSRIKVTINDTENVVNQVRNIFGDKFNYQVGE